MENQFAKEYAISEAENELEAIADFAAHMTITMHNYIRQNKIYISQEDKDNAVLFLYDVISDMVHKRRKEIISQIGEPITKSASDLLLESFRPRELPKPEK